MRALIFAAGLGTRLYPLTQSRPKALVEVGGEPMLSRVIRNLKAAGVTHAVINVHHFADMIANYLHDNANFGIDIAISYEPDAPLETGGGLLNARPLFPGDEPILLHNADIATDLDLRSLTLPHGAAATLLVSDRQSSRRLVFDRDTMSLRGWLNTDTGETRPDTFNFDPKSMVPLSFNGIHLFSPSLFPELESYSKKLGKPAFSITPFYLHCAAKGLLIKGHTASDYTWFDIGRPESLAAANARFS